jgi:P-type E1-E2 ATPase
MLTVNIPATGVLELNHIVLDFNGTIACDGKLLPGVAEKLNLLSDKLDIHILTADTFGTCAEACRGIRGSVNILAEPAGTKEKESFVTALGASKTAAVGNGANDCMMLRAAALGILVIEKEGAAVKSLQAADVVVTDISHALDMLLQPKRLTATLRG